MRISDWSSDVCSSDPPGELVVAVHNLGDRESGPDAAPIRVAIVDDSTVARAMMGWTLEKAGMDVVATASNGREAISARSEEHTSELQSLMRISYAVFCLKKKKNKIVEQHHQAYTFVY